MESGIHGQGCRRRVGQDTGYQWDHPALRQQYRGWDGSTANHDYHWHDAIHTTGSNCLPDSKEPCDDDGHGTHTMGTIVGDDGGVNQIGVAPGARWIGCRNMNKGVGTPATYIECFEFFLAPYPVGGNASQGQPSMAPHIINNSWSCPLDEGCDETHIALLEQTVGSREAAGIMVVASAGNGGSSLRYGRRAQDVRCDVHRGMRHQQRRHRYDRRLQQPGTGTALIKPTSLPQVLWSIQAMWQRLYHDAGHINGSTSHSGAAALPGRHARPHRPGHGDRVLAQRDGCAAHVNAVEMRRTRCPTTSTDGDVPMRSKPFTAPWKDAHRTRHQSLLAHLTNVVS